MQKLLIVLSILLAHLSLQGQDLPTTYQFAQDRIALGEFDEAIEALHRVVFFDKEKEYKEAYGSLAECYHLSQNLDQAIRYYDIAYFLTDDDSLKYEFLFNKTNCLLQQHKFKYALVELYNLPDSLPQYFEDKKHFYTAIVDFGQEDYVAAQENFLKLVKGNEKATEEINNLFVKNDKLKRFNPKTALWLSTFVPGLGQMYMGDFQSGINSLLINAAFYVLFVSVIRTGTFWEAILFVYPWFQRYYVGGINGAKRSAVQQKKEKRAEIYQNILWQIEHRKAVN